MKSKKLLSVCLALAMVCACFFGMLTLSANAAATTWKVDGTQYANLQAALDAAATTTWAAGDELIIEITATDAQTVKAVDGVLFGVKTIFRADKTRLPITIQGGTLTCDDSITGMIACANSYNFKNLAFDIASKEVQFYAGAGEVALTVVDLGTTNKAHFYGDNCTAKAFEGWTAEHVAANKVEGYIDTSMTFDGTSYNSNFPGVSNTSEVHTFGAYSSYVAAVGGVDEFGAATDAVKATDLRCELVITGGASLQDVSTRDVVAFAPVKEIIVTISGSDTSIDTYFGMGANVDKTDTEGVSEGNNVAETIRNTKATDYGECNFTFNMSDGATAKDRIFLVTCAKFTGNVNINMTGCTIKSQAAMTHYSLITGNVNVVLDGVTFANQFWGCRSSEITGTVTTTMKGGTTCAQARINQSVKINGDMVNNLYEMSTANSFYLTGYSAVISGTVTTNIYPGYGMSVEKNVMATGHKEYPATVGNVVTNIYGGVWPGSFTASGAETTVLGNVEVNVEFAADDAESIINGSISGSYGPTIINGNITMNLKKCRVGGNINLVNGEGTILKGDATLNIDGAEIGGNVYGNSSAVAEKTININVKSGTIGGYLFASGKNIGAGAATAIPGENRGTVTLDIDGGTFKKGVFGGAEGTASLGDIVVDISGGEFLGDVYATCGGAGVTETSVAASANNAVMTVTGGTFDGVVAANYTNGTYTTTVSGRNSLTMADTINVKAYGSLQPTEIATGKTLTVNQVEAWCTGTNYVSVAEALKASITKTTATGVKGTAVEATANGVYTITGTEAPAEREPEPEPEPSTTTTVTTTKKVTTTTKKATTTTAAAGATTTTAAAAADDAGFPWVIVIVAAVVVVAAAVVLIVFRGKIFKKK